MTTPFVFYVWILLLRVAFVRAYERAFLAWRLAHASAPRGFAATARVPVSHRDLAAISLRRGTTRRKCEVYRILNPFVCVVECTICTYGPLQCVYAARVVGKSCPLMAELNGGRE